MFYRKLLLFSILLTSNEICHEDISIDGLIYIHRGINIQAVHYATIAKIHIIKINCMGNVFCSMLACYLHVGILFIIISITSGIEIRFCFVFLMSDILINSYFYFLTCHGMCASRYLIEYIDWRSYCKDIKVSGMAYAGYCSV